MTTRSIPSAYFSALGNDQYRASRATAGAWDPEQQHIAPVMGLMAHVLERSQAPEKPLQLARLSFDIFGTVPIGDMTVTVDLSRPGRTIELSEVTVTHAGRTIAVMRAWSLVDANTSDMALMPVERLPGPEEFAHWDAADVWPGDFIASLEGRRRSPAPGRAQAWLRTQVPLVEGEASSDFARYLGLIDVANGLTLAVDPDAAAYPNVDSTVSFFRQPGGEWVGLDVTAFIGSRGVGLTHTLLHDLEGPVGVLTQSLTIRRMPSAS
ncbi:thioesterase family protein [Nesterenkonia natronophila]|uniref:Thioesterase family protein n=1 Tax=Nesterenkonia natronophila TaxID=2174932 RepID=A0A3A4F506_9MICC|nr:thioesterase family protein [Nesterenkonia natronophila]RJN32811.1 thioesterase family protein [Nesterenkonia natronophila]